MMIKTYRKTARAEQFDGSQEMIQRWHIRTLLNVGDWLAKDADGKLFIYSDEIFKKTFVEVKE